MELEAFRKSFLARVVPDSKTGCWLWTGGMLPAGYGVATWNRPDSRVVGKPAHRWAWELLRGPIPKGLEIDHICRVRLCVNPDHLGLVTHAENVAGNYKTDAGTLSGHELLAEAEGSEGDGEPPLVVSGDVG